MALAAIALLPFGKARTAPLPLAFIADARTLRQTRVAGRTALVPDLDLSEYRLKAVIDWVEIRVAFKTVTQHRYVQEVLLKYLPRQSMITPVSLGEGGECNNFDIRIQEPESLARVYPSGGGRLTRSAEFG